MIKIIKGVYGYLDKNGCVKPKTPKDEPFALSEEQEARLVGLGVAVYVDAPEPVSEPEDPKQETPESTSDDMAADTAEDVDRLQVQTLLDEMSAKELREYGKGLGLTFKVGQTKAEMREQIEAALESLSEDEDDEAPPTFDAAEAVQ